MPPLTLDNVCWTADFAYILGKLEGCMVYIGKCPMLFVIDLLAVLNTILSYKNIRCFLHALLMTTSHHPQLTMCEYNWGQMWQNWYWFHCWGSKGWWEWDPCNLGHWVGADAIWTLFPHFLGGEVSQKWWLLRSFFSFFSTSWVIQRPERLSKMH